MLANKGAKTAGIDGVTKKELASNTAKDEFVSKLQAELRSKQFKPKPVRRVYIPKANGKRRPLGIAMQRKQPHTWISGSTSAYFFGYRNGIA